MPVVWPRTVNYPGTSSMDLIAAVCKMASSHTGSSGARRRPPRRRLGVRGGRASGTGRH